MPWFRDCPAKHVESVTEERLLACISTALHPGNFYVGLPLRLRFGHTPVVEEVVWEEFHGRILDHTQTRQTRHLLTWNIWAEPDSDRTEPLLAVRYDQEARRVHVTRSIRCQAWEPYADKCGAIVTREAVRRVRELVGTIDLEHVSTLALFCDELAALLFLAVVGTSRLPLTSVATPLPEFALGQIAYCFRQESGPASVSRLGDWIAAVLDANPGLQEKARLLELVLRNPGAPNANSCLADFRQQWLRTGHAAADLLALLKTVFNDVSLSPYLGLVRTAFDFVEQLVAAGAIAVADQVDFLAHLLRQLGRHLTAYDLVQFHHRGANYPDALLLDEVLNELLRFAERIPQIFLTEAGDSAATARTKRLRRRGLRQGWLLACFYRGHLVPDAPTSPGENLRVMPTERVPEEQILNPTLRQRRLSFAFLDRARRSDVLAAILRQCIDDLVEPTERRELGVALFLDRPMGFGRHAAVPDQTLLFSYEAFSCRLALERVRQIETCLPFTASSEFLNSVAKQLATDKVAGIPVAHYRSTQRAGVACLEDALLAASDFVFVRSTRRTLQELQHWYDLTPLHALGLGESLKAGQVLILRSPEHWEQLELYDGSYVRRACLRVDVGRGYRQRLGIEHPVAGLVVTCDNQDHEICLLPRFE